MDEIESNGSGPPNSVVRAAALIVVSALLGVLRFWLDFDRLIPPGEEGAAIAGFLVVIGSMLLFTYLALRGRNWARVVFLVLVLVGLLPALAVTGEELQRNATLGLISLAQAACQVVGIILFFLPVSNDWYRQVKAARDLE